VIPHDLAETIESHGCSIVLRRVEGPDARELFFSCRPPVEVAEPEQQAEVIYRAILALLDTEGGSVESLVGETLFLRSANADLESVRAARDRVLATRAGPARPAMAEIEQPPLNEGSCLEVAIHAVLPNRSPLQIDRFDARPACRCAECVRQQALRLELGAETRFSAGGLCGRGESAYAQTLDMFAVAEDLLQQAGFEFGDVVRTWIHLREMERDYDDLNGARREFFEARGIDPVPASTGIGGGPVGAEHDLSLGIYAVKAAKPPERTVMTSPTLNEAMSYGADFVRGMKVVEANKVALHVSGTASVDEAGRTAHPGDFDAQADRMLHNIAALLDGQGATFGNIVSAVTYLKHPADGDRLRAKLHEAGFEGFPNVLVEAEVCRPELLCETEALAVLPRVTSISDGD
jgi:enamine deaminase RidA (YjgF/YER057c/UK114 family)